MEQWLKNNKARVRASYGSMPDDETQEVRRTLSRFEEETPVKKKLAGGTVLIAAMLLALVGVALAIGNYGVLTFLFKGQETNETVQQSVQTGFTQTGGELSDLTVRVRDAVCDGIMLIMTVEMKTKNPDDVLMLTEDKSILFHNEQGREFPPPTGRERNVPDWSAFPEDRHFVYGSSPIMTKNADGAYDPTQPFLIGLESYYENPQTAIHTMIYDVTRRETPADSVPIAFTIGTNTVLGTKEAEDDGKPLGYDILDWDRQERTDVRVDVRIAPVEKKVFAPKEPVITVGRLRITDATFTVTPYALYFESNSEWIPDEPDASTLVTVPGYKDNLRGLTDDLGREYLQLFYSYVSTSVERDQPLERDRTIYTGHGAPFPKTLTLRGFYQRDSDLAYETTVELVEVKEP